jgi:hypothetical protein
MGSRRMWVDLDDIGTATTFIGSKVVSRDSNEGIDWSNVGSIDTSAGSQAASNTQPVTQTIKKDPYVTKATDPEPSFEPGEPEKGIKRLPAYNPDPEFFIIIPPPDCQFAVPSIVVTPPEENNMNTSDTQENSERHSE